jgi:hypothetical protein
MFAKIVALNEVKHVIVAKIVVSTTMKVKHTIKNRD